MVGASIVGIASGFPTTVSQSDVWQKYFESHYKGSPLARRMFERSGIATRHAAIEPYVEDVSYWSTEQRMQRYLPEAIGLGKTVVQSALDNAGIAPQDVGQFVVASCTGYATPGLDVLLAHDMGLNNQLKRTFVGHMGCHAAMPSLEIAANHVAMRDSVSVVLCVELPSLHVQPPTDDVDQIVAHALFSDGAAATVVAPSQKHSLALVDFACISDFETADLMKWNITDRGFRMELSHKVPDVLANHVGALVSDLLERNGIANSEVTGWAVHPGGPRILDVVQERLAITDDQMEFSRAVLRQHGNCSSPTVLVVLDSLLEHGGLRDGDYVVSLAFGPGLTLQAALLKFDS